MNDKISDLLYTVRNMCEALRDRPEILDMEIELKEMVDDAETLADEIGELTGDE